jgi:putative ABC transport system permease protein
MSIWMATLGQFIAVIIALGAAFGGMNTMYSAVASRRREIGVLRSLGFGRGAVLLSFLLESLALCAVGGVLGLLLGAGLSLVPIDVPFLPASRVALELPQLLWSQVLALCIGLFGGGLPALQAARLPLVDALR